MQTGWREDEVAKDAPQNSTLENLRGPLCGALEARLLTLTHMSVKHKVCRNNEIDAALVDKRTNRARAIFEVLSSLKRGAALHAAVGRLLCHRHIYGDDNTLLCVALASEEESQDIVIKQLFERSKIVVVVRDGADFVTTAGEALAQLLDPVLTR